MQVRVSLEGGDLAQGELKNMRRVLCFDGSF